MDGEFTERVLQVVEAIPRGHVLSYGAVAALLDERHHGLGGGPRQVGRVMSLHGDAVPWWRVVRADGRPPRCHEATAVEHYRLEGTPLRAGGAAIDMRRAVWTPDR